LVSSVSAYFLLNRPAKNNSRQQNNIQKTAAQESNKIDTSSWKIYKNTARITSWSRHLHTP